MLDYLKELDWSDEVIKKTGLQLMTDAEEYWKRVEAHIFGGNEIRADMFMSFAEKQDEISTLDRRRTAAHDRMLRSFAPFLDLLRNNTSFNEDDWKLANRTQIADFVAGIVFEALGLEPASRKEGEVRDELAEKLHKQEVTFEQIEAELKKLASA